MLGTRLVAQPPPYVVVVLWELQINNQSLSLP
jgi:hypothetical protein